MLQILYTIIISPIEFIIEFVFVFFYKVFHNLAIPLFGVSFAVSLLSLPLYMMAEHWQIIERNITEKLKPGIKKIKSVFKNDEQFMVLSVFYRQNKYHPIYALRSSLGIFIQVPFFIAAYSYLTHLEILQGISFYFIADLGKSDALFNIGNFRINILPVLMTMINCIAGAVYTKNLPIRDKVQVYGLALVFLVLLYNSPSALVIYWTLNNIFSLVKNIFYKIKNPQKIIYIIGCIVSILLIFYLLFFMQTRVFSKRLLVVCVISLFFFIPVILKGIQYFYQKLLLIIQEKTSNILIMLLFSCLILVILAGLYIPSLVISSSPQEFSLIDNISSPFEYLSVSFFFYLGIFLIWPICIYFLFSKKIKILLSIFIAFLSIIASLYAIIFSGNYGDINNTFQFITTGVLKPSVIIAVTGILVFLPVFPVIYIIFRKSGVNTLNAILSLIMISLLSVSVYNIVKIRGSYRDLIVRSQNENDAKTIEPVFTLSGTNKNIIVIMADTAINGFVPLLFDDLPGLYDQFDGFTLFRNTASFSSHTLMGVPAVWGGYEYTPLEMNRKSNIPLAEKHNQALLTLPLLLVQSGFDVTVTDPSWANYAWIPDTSIYNDYENITAFNTERRYTGIWFEENDAEKINFTSSVIKRNIIWFSFLKINNPLLRSIIYDNGWYWNTGNMGSSILDFINSYSVLDYLCDLTSFDSEGSRALLITNETPHKFGYLDSSSFKPTSIPQKIGGTPYAESDYYHTNAALYMKIGDWLDLLRENNVYDNTRIIIAADHGAGINGLIPGEPLKISGENREKYNPVLLFKDFDQHGRLNLNYDFMTNADVPSIALQGLLENPVNPFTGNPVSMEPKKDGINISTCHIPMAEGHGKFTFNIKSNQWIFLKDSIFESSNWVSTEN